MLDLSKLVMCKWKIPYDLSNRKTDYSTYTHYLGCSKLGQDNLGTK